MIENQIFIDFKESLSSGDSIAIDELWGGPKALISAIAQKITGKHLLIITGQTQEESKLFHDLSYFTKNMPLLLPQWETLPGETAPPSADIVGERFSLLKEIIEDKSPKIILTTLQAALQQLVPKSRFESLYLPLAVGDDYPFDAVGEQLEEMGYERKGLVGDKGEYAIRGGIIDLFPVTSPDPVRIEFWGDQIESIRTFDPISQRSKTQIERVDITLGKEKELLQEEKISILDYLGDQTLVIFDDLLAIEDREVYLKSLIGNQKVPFLTLDELLDRTKTFQTLFWADQPLEELSKIDLRDKSGNYYAENQPPLEISFNWFHRDFHIKKWNHPFTPVLHYLLPESDQKAPPSFDELFQKAALLKDHHLALLFTTETEQHHYLENHSIPEHIETNIGYLASGFVIPSEKKVLFPITELTLRYKIRRQKLRSTYHSAPAEVFDLTPGEMVVHLKNGIGKFLGIDSRIDHNGAKKEFFSIEYANDSKLFVPFDQAHMISKYIGANDTIPKLHALGSTQWKRALVKTQIAIDAYAKDLIELYAHRKIVGGISCPTDGEDLIAFEEDFPFAETEDQLAAIASIKSDMQSCEAMDRLVCGDVGYGKTEVAMRAAFKAVVDGGKQVAMLVPTTVLAMQHYENFVERMSNFPVSIACLSRFRTPKQIKESLEQIASGQVDIIVGTHRILSKDVLFKNLGLIIIDEEQRFGVKAKEHLKTLKNGVDCLTLSATPIPRTLYMSLVGAKDMSLINTPPQERLPIKTIITEPNEEAMKNALLRELARDGQAFVIHNRVETIWSMADRIKKMLPQARVQVAHGQMDPKEIDTVFHAYKTGQLDILVATSIIENGVDIPNANTIIIDRADRFGLAELYQLRGRVGRWNRKAYAYFLIPKFHLLPEVSRKRIQALAEASGYGGGMKLAMRDLEIRGAGDILGTKQSGNIATVGFDLYCKMLNKKVKELKGGKTPRLSEITISLPFDARVPAHYIQETNLRLEIYHRLGDATSVEEVDALFEEMKDRYGTPPIEVLWLIHETRLKVFAQTKNITLLSLQKMTLKLEMETKKEPIKTTHLLKNFTSPQEMEDTIRTLIQLLWSQLHQSNHIGRQ